LTGCTPFFGDDLDEIILKNTNATVCYEFQEIGIKISSSGIIIIINSLEFDEKITKYLSRKETNR